MFHKEFAAGTMSIYATTVEETYRQMVAKLSRVVQKNVATFDEFGGKVDSITAGEMMTESVCLPPTPWNVRPCNRESSPW